MNARIAKKRAARMVCSALSLPMVLDHARPSFFALRDVGLQRACLREQLKKLGVRSPDARRWVARTRWPDSPLAALYSHYASRRAALAAVGPHAGESPREETR